MKTFSATFASLALLLCCALSTAAIISFEPAEVTLATNVEFPNRSIANGIVVLDVSLDSMGNARGVHVQRDIASLTAVATSSVRNWKYEPASVGGAPRASLFRVAFAFRPDVILASPPDFTPLSGQAGMSPESYSGYVPPGIIAAAYPSYPIDARNVGAVVIQVSLNAAGKVKSVKAIRSFYPFTQFALDAARKWQFQAATLNGVPVDSNVAIAFVYSFPGVHE